MSQGEESHGYQELVAAAKRVDSVPVAICTEKEVWADYSLASGTITLFRKVFYTIVIKSNMRHVFNNRRDGCCHFYDDDTDDVDVRHVIQADNHQENLDLTEAKKLDADGLVNFITINEVRYITEYDQVVGLTRHHCHFNVFLEPTACLSV